MTVPPALLFPEGRLVWLRDAWVARRFTPLTDRDCTDELLRVLAYPKFALDRSDIAALLGSYLPYAETVEPTSTKSWTKRCTDPQDRKFLALADTAAVDRVGVDGGSEPFPFDRIGVI